MAARLIDGLHDAKGRVAIKGFYDGVVPPSKDDRKAVAAFAAALYNETADFADVGAAGPPVGERGYTTLERRWLRPTCDVVGVASGFDGPRGSVKTIVPATARVKVVCRLVPNQQPDRVVALARAHFERLGVPGVSVYELPFKATPYTVPRDTPTDVGAVAVFRQLYGADAPVYETWMGGSIPVTAAFKQHLGVDTTLFAFGLPDDRVHAPDERYRLAQYRIAREAYARVLYELGGGREGEALAAARAAERDEL